MENIEKRDMMVYGQPIQNSEVRIDPKGNRAVVITRDGGDVSPRFSVSCYVDWSRDGIFIRARSFKTNRGAEAFAAKFFDGLR